MEKAVDSPSRMPLSSQVLELTMPMAAVAPAPIWPTMAASMYSMAVTTSCSRMEGMLRVRATCAVSRREMSPPCRIRAESCSSENVMLSPLIKNVLPEGFLIIRAGPENVKSGGISRCGTD